MGATVEWKGNRLGSTKRQQLLPRRLGGTRACMPLQLLAALAAQPKVTAAAARLEEGQHQLAGAVEDDL